PLPAVGFSLATTRAVLERRGAVAAVDHAGLLRGLEALAEDRLDPQVARGTGVPPVADGRGAADGRVAFLFAGQGAQRLGMGRQLCGAFPVFAGAFDVVCEQLDLHLDGSVRDVVFGADAAVLDRTVWAQAGLFAVEVALFRLLQ